MNEKLTSQLDRIYDEETENLGGQWRQNHFRIMIILSIVVVAAETLLSLLLIWGDLIDSPTEVYFVKYLAVPWLTYAAVDIVTALIYRFSRLGGHAMNYVVSLAFSLLCLTVCFFHDYFVVSFAGGVLAISLTTIYGDRRLTGVTTLSIIVCEMLLTILPSWDGSVVRDETYMINIALVVLIELSTYLISFTIVEWEDKRRNAVVVRQAEIEELRRTAERDQLTGLRNRHGLREYIDESRPETLYAMMDIDHFKAVNDKWGHDTGDKVLCGLGKVLLSEENDRIAAFRYGGDEFLLVTNDCARDEVTALCEDIRKQFLAVLPEEMREIGVDLSFGVSDKGVAAEPSDAIRSADGNMYKAKHSD
jgi:diguanylate cyclase (GGDEF)-like protein